MYKRIKQFIQPTLILMIFWSVITYFLAGWQIGLVVLLALISTNWLSKKQSLTDIEEQSNININTDDSAMSELIGESARIFKEQLTHIDSEQQQVNSLLNDAIVILSDSFHSLSHQAEAQQQIFNRLFQNESPGEMSLDQFGTEVEKLLNYFVDLILQTSKDSVYLMHSLDDMTQRVNSVLGLLDEVKDIASSISLLSLNASIEAARAGDAGRGFSVVAQEIRKLSVSTDKVSDEINKLSSEVIEKLGNVTDVVHRVASSDMNVAFEGKDRVSGMTNYITKENMTIQEAVAESNNLSSQISVSVNRAVQSMQFEDMCRQLLEHVGKRANTLQDIADFTNNIGESLESVKKDPAAHAEMLIHLKEKLKALEPKMQAVAHKSVDQQHLDSGDIELF